MLLFLTGDSDMEASLLVFFWLTYHLNHKGLGMIITNMQLLSPPVHHYVTALVRKRFLGPVDVCLSF